MSAGEDEDEDEAEEEEEEHFAHKTAVPRDEFLSYV